MLDSRSGNLEIQKNKEKVRIRQGKFNRISEKFYITPVLNIKKELKGKVICSSVIDK